MILQVIARRDQAHERDRDRLDCVPEARRRALCGRYAPTAGALLLGNAMVYRAPDGNEATGNAASDIGFRIIEDSSTIRL